MKLRMKVALACSIAIACMAARADDAVTVKLEMADGKLTPARIEVPAG